ncbi:hypothetical protein BGX23_002914 [Mortierella sp. AD031]|nr:hypothetical protein BGX23_002914 [Mortierella sp. AD031]
MVFKTSLSVLIVATLAMICALAPQAEAHSWASCVDWKPDGKTNKWTKGKCLGYARRYPTNKKFGKLDSDSPNRHYEQMLKNVNSRPACSRSKDDKEIDHAGADETRPKKFSDAYSTGKFGPMTMTTAGDTLCIQWPAKNHKDDRDGGRVLINWMKDDGKVNHPQSVLNKYEIATLDFSNCDKGDEDTRACGGCITVPKEATPGMYLLQWRWRLNGGKDTDRPAEWYTSCADVQVNKK